MYFLSTYQSPVGLITLASDGDNLTGLWIEGQKYHGYTIPKTMSAPQAIIHPETLTKTDSVQVIERARKWLDRYFAGKKPDISELPLAPAGSEFRHEIWNILCEIPYGKVMTYGDIAKRIAVKRKSKSMSGQAIGGAVGHNPISIIIPCHRVVGSNGSLTGYAAGIEIKAKLLELEGVSTGRDMMIHRLKTESGQGA
ncbi:MAG: methylated-DNA--[protein]-cysteine S-methyltransferase [Oscillospiraceae bacterium]|nr:methylated-DNA--[protein]-cysteine S-methyltransferase [Oscillospiraceae bacterium]